MKKTARRPKNDFKKPKSMSQNLSPPEKKLANDTQNHKKVIIILVVAIRIYCEKEKRKCTQKRNMNFHIRQLRVSLVMEFF